MDPDQEAGGKCQWMLHQNAANGPECALAGQQPINNQDQYGSLPSEESVKNAGRLRLAGHCACHNEETASKELLWELQHGHPNRGGPKRT